MSRGNKLINKLERRQRSVREATESVPKMNKSEETLQGSPAAHRLMRGAARRRDESFGYAAVGQEPVLEYRVVAATLDRFDYDLAGDFGMRLTLASAAEARASGAQPGDSIQILEGALEGRMLEVVSVTGSAMRLDDVASFTAPENTVACRVLLSAEKKSYQ